MWHKRILLALIASLMLGMVGARASEGQGEDGASDEFIGGCMNVRGDGRDASAFATDDEKRRAQRAREYYSFHPAPPMKDEEKHTEVVPEHREGGSRD